MKANQDEKIRKLLLKRGKQYKPALLPADIQRGPIGKCFDWCAVQCAMNFPKYQYIEGIALDPDEYRKGKQKWILHAWLSDGEHAFDPTWAADDDGVEQPVPTVYIGLSLPFLKVRDFMSRTGYQGVLANSWRAPEFVNKMLKALDEVQPIRTR